MNEITKDRSPFFPGQPVPIDLFTGREEQIHRIERALMQVSAGKPQAIFLEGEYGIGKSSLAGFMRFVAEKSYNLAGMHVLLGGARKMEDVAARTVENAIQSRVYTETGSEKVRNALAKYIGSQELFGIKINLEILKADAPSIYSSFLPFLRNLYGRLREDGAKGIMLIFDEINGIAENPDFAHFVKGLVDENALSHEPLPVLLLLCGVEERRRQMIQNHTPVERIFDVVQIEPMTLNEMEDFFKKAFESVRMKVTDEALNLLCYYSAGFPKIMHLVGDNVFWIDNDNVIDPNDALKGILLAADEVGKKYVDQQVYKALRSEDYRSILAKLSRDKFNMTFIKKDMEKGLAESEKKKLNNFLQRMKKLGVLQSGEHTGEYIFTSRLVRLYLLLDSIKKPSK